MDPRRDGSCEVCAGGVQFRPYRMEGPAGVTKLGQLRGLTAFITEDDMRRKFGVGRNASSHLAVAQRFCGGRLRPPRADQRRSGSRRLPRLLYLRACRPATKADALPLTSFELPRYERIDKWALYDRTKNRSAAWCGSQCEARARARRHRRRHRKDSA
jgi:hypothetical protein